MLQPTRLRLYHDFTLFFKCLGDGSELFDYNLPYPHYYDRSDNDHYTIGWRIEGLGTTPRQRAYISDLIARLIVTLPVIERLTSKEGGIRKLPEIKAEPIHPKAFANAKSVSEARKMDYKLKNRAQEQTLMTHINPADHSPIFYAIKFEAERRIRAEKGYLNYDGLEEWALANFEGYDKDRSTIKSRCRSVWHWYESRDFKTHESKNTREGHIREVHEKRRSNTRQKVINALEGLEFLQEDITPRKVAEHAGISLNTAKKYMADITHSRARECAESSRESPEGDVTRQEICVTHNHSPRLHAASTPGDDEHEENLSYVNHQGEAFRGSG